MKEGVWNAGIETQETWLKWVPEHKNCSSYLALTLFSHPSSFASSHWHADQQHDGSQQQRVLDKQGVKRVAPHILIPFFSVTLIPFFLLRSDCSFLPPVILMQVWSASLHIRSQRARTSRWGRGSSMQNWLGRSGSTPTSLAGADRRS